MKRFVIIPAAIALLSSLAILAAVPFQSAHAEDGIDKVTGENCVAPVPEVGYRPSLYECNGNAAILLRGSFRNAYSVVLRRRGQYNDRDPHNVGCGTNRCSPYKVQKKIELSEYQVNCLGGSGYSELIQLSTRISVKFTAKVTNSLDPNQFQQYCLASTETDLN